MKILVMCPGHFTHGLNSPERGEGRWAQNYARMLAQAGHEVYAASGGLGSRVVEQYGVKLIEQAPQFASKFEPFDLYMDSAWWDGRVPAAKAKKYVSLHWAPENHLYKPLPENRYIAYPYTTHHYNFSRTNFLNRDKAFALPTMFGDDFHKPNWEATKVFLPGKIDMNRQPEKYFGVIGDFLAKHPIEGTSRKQFQEFFSDKVDFDRPDSNWHQLIPYDQVLDAMSRSKISLPILNPGAVIEAAFMGVPSVFWGHGGFYNPLAESLNMVIEHEAPPERFTEVVELLMNNRKKYHEVVYASQDYFVSHTYKESLKYFNFMAESIGLL